MACLFAAVSGATSGAISLHDFYFELPLAQALQFEMVHYRRDLNRACYVPDRTPTADVMAEFDAIRLGKKQDGTLA